ncbi:MAG: SusC/RagA family TonB-linked outer membrane protein [Chitinophagaceae bacterium]|nr:MAG: SusC/RagA family TonB-linked outer membrane protein [Chitinophagaceae bacterium]
MRKFAMLLFALLGGWIMIHAQQRTVSGTVKNEKGEPVPFATVTDKQAGRSVAADAEGKFSILVTGGAVLEISSSGFKTFTIGSDADLSVLVLQGGNDLQEVVVTALGQQRQAKELGYSTAKVKASELTQAKPVNLQNGLTGKVSGLNISTTNNGVFADTRITLRGIRSLTGNNQPMLIVDGVPVALGYINAINPNDIADVTILKSSSSTAVYGPDGVNGAIVVTTKKGVKGKPVISFSHNFQIETLAFMPKFQKQFGSGYSNDDRTGYGTYDSVEQQSWGDRFDGSMRALGEPGPNGEKMVIPYSYDKKGRSSYFVNGFTQQTDLSYSAGDFYLSVQNVGIRGILAGDKNDRRTVTMKADREYGRFKAGFNIRYTNSQYDITNNNEAVYYGVTSAPGQIHLDNFRNWRTDYFSSPDGYYTTFMDNWSKTPFFAKDNWRERGRTDDLFGNGELNFKAASWLNLTYRVGLAISNGDSRSTVGSYVPSDFHRTRLYPYSKPINAAVTSSSLFGTRLNSETFANAAKRFGKIGTGLLIGHSYRETGNRLLGVGSNNLGTSTLFSIAARKGEPAANDSTTRVRLERFFGRLSFDFDNWVFVEATGSYDFDSRLAHPNGNFTKSDIGFFYPGVSTSILLHQVIPAVKNSRWISYLKLRGALSRTGNVNLPAYAFQNIVELGEFFPYGNVSGVQTAKLTLSDRYKPEFVVNTEAGIEMSFLKNRINVQATWYTQDNTDQVIDVALSSATGFSEARVNAASFKNKGLEFDLNLTPLVRINGVSIDLKMNYSHQANKVYSLVDGVNELGIGNGNFIIVGESAYKFKLTDYVRDDQGRVIVDAQSGMPSINPNLTMFGNTTPTDFLGINLNLHWKDFNFSAVVDYRGGNQVLSDRLGAFLDDNGISERSGQNGRRAFIFPNSVYDDGTGKYVVNTDVFTSNYARYFYNSDLNTGVQTNYLASGAFWKIRELAISYEVPVRSFGVGLRRVIKGVSVGVTGRNLFMFLPKSNVWTDPEFSAQRNNAYTGNATGRNSAYNMPPTRIFGANVQVLF